MARVLWLHKSGINEEQQGGDILPLCDAAEISNRTTYSLWVATDVTTSRETGKHTGEKPLPFFFFPDRFKVLSLFHSIKKIKRQQLHPHGGASNMSCRAFQSSSET